MLSAVWVVVENTPRHILCFAAELSMLCACAPPVCVILRIDDDVSTALVNLEAGEAQLFKKNDSLSYKWLAAKVAAILFLFAIIFILFIA